MRLALRSSFCVYTVQMPGSRRATIETDYAPAVVARLHEIADAHPLHGVHVVGHSMGGIVAVLAAAHPSLIGRIGRVVTISAPHRGAPLLRWLPACTARHQEMTPGSRMLLQLLPHAFQLLSVQDVPILALSGVCDFQVPHPAGWPHDVDGGCCGEQGNVTCETYWGLGHTSVAVAPHILKHVRCWLLLPTTATTSMADKTRTAWRRRGRVHAGVVVQSA